MHLFQNQEKESFGEMKEAGGITLQPPSAQESQDAAYFWGRNAAVQRACLSKNPQASCRYSSLSLFLT